MLEPKLLEWPLAPGDVVIDGGAYEGDFCFAVAERYRCRVEAFEMMPAAAAKLMEAAAGGPSHWRVNVHAYALGDEDDQAKVVDLASCSSLHLPTPSAYHLKTVAVRDVVGVLEGMDVDEIALLKLNIEGAEYAVLERLLVAGWMSRIKRLLIQFHRNLGEDQVRRRDVIRAALAETHREVWCDPWRWEAWERK